MKALSTEELQKKLEKNNIHLIEVLEEEEFKKEHIKGAV